MFMKEEFNNCKLCPRNCSVNRNCGDLGFCGAGNKITIADWKTNKEIKTKSYYNNKTKSSVKMKFPLNNLDDVNYWHYTLQLSTYAWMVQKLNPEFEIEDLVLVHFDHNDKMTVYHLPYLKDEVIKMLNHFKKESALKASREKRKPVIY